MFGHLAEAVALYRVFVSSFRTQFGALLAWVANLSRGSGLVWPAKAGNPPHQKGRQMSVEALGQDLADAYGRHKVNSSGDGIFSVDVSKGKYLISVGVNLSPNCDAIRMIARLGQLPDQARISALALLNLLNKNHELAPMFFMIQGDRIALAYQVPNRDLSAALVKEHIDKLSLTAVRNVTIWNPRPLQEEA